jgi:hypothetical protein
MSTENNVGQKHQTTVDYKFFENLGNFGCFGTELRNQNCMHDEIKADYDSNKLTNKMQQFRKFIT